jgi:hypothetical protein
MVAPELPAPELLAAVLLALATVAAALMPRALDAVDRGLRRLLHRPAGDAAWAASLAGVALAGQLLTGLWTGAPVARIHDEHSLLLQADTFAHGRLANPPPALPRHFETFHVLVRPTYASKYPPALGAPLAAGRLLGHPALGLWLSGALFCAAAAWMLAAWLPPRWARLAGVLVLLTTVLATTWSHTYRSGFVPAAAGALLFGAAARLRWRRVRARDGLALGAAIGLLALSRPWEGLFATAAALAPLAVAAARSPGRRRDLLRRAAGPASIAVVTALGWLGWYHWRVTGDPFTFPYRVHDERYARVPLFLWQELREPAPANPQIDALFRDFEAAEWERQHTVAGWLAASRDKLAELGQFYLRGLLLPALLALPVALRRPRPPVLWAAAAGVLLLLSQLLIVPTEPHYVAPGAALFAVPLVEGLRRLRLWRLGGRAFGRRLAAALPLGLLLLVPLRAAGLRPPNDDWALVRERLQRRLAALPGKDLVLVRYDPRHSPHAEWVYNGADLAATEVLWARSLGPAADCALVAAERGRHVWTITVVEALTPARLDPVPPSACASVSSPRRTAAAAPPPATAR